MGLLLNVKVQQNKIKISKGENHGISIQTMFKRNLKLEFGSYGIFGTISIGNVQYIIFIVRATKVCDIFDNPVYEIKEIRLLQTSGDFSSTNLRLLSDLYSFFKLPGIYFSEYPLYENFSYKNKNDFDFLFNYDCLTNLKKISKKLNQYAVNCIQGFLDIKRLNDLHIGIISRRSWRRTGSRYFSRGLGESGYVSNFVETEVFLYKEKQISSFLQIRGSIPLNWSHNVNLKYMPEIKIDRKCCFEKSNTILEEKYGEVFYLNLIKHQGYESAIFRKFSYVLNSYKQLHMNYDIASEGITYNTKKKAYFLDILSTYLDKFSVKSSKSSQKGVIRTNCIDCLDRTNLCQYLISNYMIKNLLQEFEDVEPSDVEKILRGLWYNNGNILSIQYSGTQAMKSFVLNGGNAYLGRLRDAYISVKRYFINRWFHGKLQNACDIITGNFNKKNISTLSKKKSFKYEIYRKIMLQLFIFFLLYFLRDKIGFYASYIAVISSILIILFQILVCYKLDFPMSSKVL